MESVRRRVRGNDPPSGDVTGTRGHARAVDQSRAERSHSEGAGIPALTEKRATSMGIDAGAAFGADAGDGERKIA